MIRLGIIGTGGMANCHADNFKNMRGVKLVACCDIVAERAQAFAERHGIPHVYSEYAKMLDTERLDAVTNVTPDAQHAPVSLAVIAHGLHILCEKPLATSLEDARAMANAARQAGVINMVNFSYRNSCGLQRAAEVIRLGKLGRIMHVESSYLQSWLAHTGWGDWRTSPGLPWRLSTKHGSNGVLGDLGCHIYDMTTLLCGDISTITCTLRTFDKGVPNNQLGEYTLDANDSFIATVEFANGALGTVHSSRWATGHQNSLRTRVFGDLGAIEVDLDRAYDEYRICVGEKALKATEWKTVKCKATPNNFQRFITSIKTGVNDPNDFANGVKIQAYLHCSMLSDEAHMPIAVESGELVSAG